MSGEELAEQVRALTELVQKLQSDNESLRAEVNRRPAPNNSDDTSRDPPQLSSSPGPYSNSHLSPSNRTLCLGASGAKMPKVFRQNSSGPPYGRGVGR